MKTWFFSKKKLAGDLMPRRATKGNKRQKFHSSPFPVICSGMIYFSLRTTNISLSLFDPWKEEEKSKERYGNDLGWRNNTAEKDQHPTIFPTFHLVILVLAGATFSLTLSSFIFSTFFFLTVDGHQISYRYAKRLFSSFPPSLISPALSIHRSVITQNTWVLGISKVPLSLNCLSCHNFFTYGQLFLWDMHY